MCFLAQKLFNKPLTIVGNGNQTRDFIHVYDLVEGILKAARSKIKNQIYNIGGGQEISVNKIANLISKKPIFPKRPGEPDRSLANISKIKRDLNWKPKSKINVGVRELIKNIKYWRDAPIWFPKKIKKATKVWFKLLK